MRCGAFRSEKGVHCRMIIIADRCRSLKRYFIILQCCLDDQLLADVFFKRPALYELARPNIKDNKMKVTHREKFFVAAT